MAEVFPLILTADGREPSRLTSADALQGTAGVIDLVGYQGGAGLLSGVLGVENLLDGTAFLWDTRFLPVGRSVYFETFASGSVATTQNTISLYADAALVVANVTTGIAGVRTRSAAIVLANQTVLSVRFKTALLGTAVLRYARLIIL